MPVATLTARVSPTHPHQERRAGGEAEAQGNGGAPASIAAAPGGGQDGDDVEVEYVVAPTVPPDADEATAAAFADVYSAFTRRAVFGRDAAAAAEADEQAALQAAGAPADGEAQAAGDGAAGGGAGENEDEEEDDGGVSRKQLKLLRRLSLAELKLRAPRPEIVEQWDCSAADPVLTVHLKAVRNSVPVPRHWSQKRKYLQGKRGVEKPPWQLPDFLAATGIGKVRDAYAEKQEATGLKGKGHDKMTAKLGRIDIDYQLLHDAFFKHQTKPRLSAWGEVYFEGKEFEMPVKKRAPGGELSAELREALGMPPGAPPPWLINQQRYGPPPSYPLLKIPGLSAPIPPGAQWGYHPGGWGRPPVDEAGRPLYGDVWDMGTAGDGHGAFVSALDGGGVDKAVRWGDVEPALEEEESEPEGDDEDEEGGDGDADADGAAADDHEAVDAAALAAGTASTVSSLVSGLETPSEVDVRKAGPRQLYSVLEQREAHVGATSLMGASHTYVVPPAGAPAAPTSAAAAAKRAGIVPGDGGAAMGTGAVLTLQPEELEAGMSDAELAARYEAAQKAQVAAARGEDFSDLVAEQAVKQKRKADAKSTKDKDKDAKRFKF